MQYFLFVVLLYCFVVVVDIEPVLSSCSELLDLLATLGAKGEPSGWAVFFSFFFFFFLSFPFRVVSLFLEIREFYELHTSPPQ